MKAIIIDDDSEDRQFLIEALSAIDVNLEVLEAPNCIDGLKHLDIRINDPIDYIFMDINMPITDGKECLSMIKRNTFLKDIPVVMLSTSSYAKDIADCLNAGAHQYIVKPNRLDELVECLNFLRREPPSLTAEKS
jgi:DNA-binding response OmpR family regulator